MLPYLRSRIMRSSSSNRRFLRGVLRGKAASESSHEISRIFHRFTIIYRPVPDNRPGLVRPRSPVRLGSTEFLAAVGVASIEDRDDKFSLRRFVVTIVVTSRIARFDNDLLAFCSPCVDSFTARNRIF